MRKITDVIIHCSDTKPNWMEGSTTDEKRDEIRRWHVEDNGWKDIGYHLIVDRDGTPADGRRVERVGAHTIGHNGGSIGICLIGGKGSNADDRFEDHFTEDQKEALFYLLDSATVAHGDVAVSGHNDYAKRACPGFDVEDFLIEHGRAQFVEGYAQKAGFDISRTPEQRTKDVLEFLSHEPSSNILDLPYPEPKTPVQERKRRRRGRRVFHGR